MTVPPPLPPEPRKRLGTGAIVAIVAGAVVTVLVLAAVVVGLVAFTSQRPQPTADESPVVTGSQAPVGPRTAFYAFAHTAVSVEASDWGLGGRIQVQRVRFTATADADAFALQMRNYRYIDDTAMSGTIAIDAAYVGLATDEVLRSDFAEPPVRVLGATELVDGDLLASGWIGTDALALEAGRDYIVSIAMRMSPDQEIAVAGDESWQAVTDDAADAGEQVLETAHVLTANMLDMQVRYSLSGDEPIVAAIGHSGNTGANQNADVHPHSGESSGWPQIWAQQQGGVVSSLAVAGSWIAQYPPDSTKWELADDTDADVVSIFAASSDLVGGAGVDLVRSEWEATIARAQEAWPDARIVAWTEPPRGASGEGEADREAWNAFIRSMPDGVDAIVDADALLADPADQTRIVPQLDGDGTHPSIEGHQAVADLFAQAMRELGY